MLGTVGQLLLFVAFAGSALSGAAYFMAARGATERAGWKALGRAAWGVVALTAVGAFVLLAYLLYTNQYQYAYVYQHASNDLAWYFTLSALWEGQEGSFLLWIFYTGLVGSALLAWSPRECRGKCNLFQRAWAARSAWLASLPTQKE